MVCAATPRPPRVGAVVLNWNGGDDTIFCLRSLASSTSPVLEVRIVDNGSTDGSLERIEREFPAWPLLRLGSNRGQAAGENAGIRASLEAGCDYVFLLNSDAVAEPGTIKGLVEVAAADGRVGIAGPTIFRWPPPTGVLWSAGERVLYPLALGWPRRRPGPGPRTVDAVQGCAVLLSRRALEATGGFDESFHTYFSDIDLCYRARRLGFRIVHVPGARVWHRGGGSTGGRDCPFVLYLEMRNILLFGRKHARGALLPAAILHAGLFSFRRIARAVLVRRPPLGDTVRALTAGARWHLGHAADATEVGWDPQGTDRGAGGRDPGGAGPGTKGAMQSPNCPRNRA